MARDEFTAAVRRVIAYRAGHRCSVPSCRIGTARPSATDQEKSIDMGEAAHITAASPLGPRYDPNLTPEERRSVANGLWCCTPCATLIDKDEASYPVAMVSAWKREAEKRAARDASAAPDVMGALLSDMEQLADEVHTFAAERRDNYPASGWPWRTEEEFATSGEALARHGRDTGGIYEATYGPRASMLLDRVAEIVGADDSNLARARITVLSGRINTYRMDAVAEELRRLAEWLGLR